MKFNSDKSKFIATIITIVLVVVVLFFSGCGTSNNSVKAGTSNNSVKANDTVFVTVSCEAKYRIVYDKETKVMYAMSDGSYNRGNFIMLVNADGTPKLYKGK